MSKITKEQVKRVVESYEKTLELFLKENGYEMNVKNVKYAQDGEITLQTIIKTRPLSVEEKEKDFEQKADWCGLFPNLYLKRVKDGRKILTITDIDLSKPKNKIILEGDNGSTYHASVETVNHFAVESGLI